jgi:hypothetical protein
MVPAAKGEVEIRAAGKHGSIAVIERLIRTIKDEATRRFRVPLKPKVFRAELDCFARWYNGERPGSSRTALRGCTPDEVYFGRAPANEAPRFEPRAKYPRDGMPVECVGVREPHANRMTGLPGTATNGGDIGSAEAESPFGRHMWWEHTGRKEDSLVYICRQVTPLT